MHRINGQAEEVIRVLPGPHLLQYFYAHIEITPSLSVHNQEALISKVIHMDKNRKDDWLAALNFLATLKYDYYFQFDKYSPGLMLDLFSFLLSFQKAFPYLGGIKVKYEVHLLALDILLFLKINPISSFDHLLFFEQNYIPLAEMFIQSTLLRFKRHLRGNEVNYEAKIIGVLLELQLLSLPQLNQVKDFLQKNIQQVPLSQLCR